ncbi:MAG: Hpt domain-containing protein [Bdellovibrionales bacterium]|nr:Hpt domain-containing protein [Bdellovibrionales bacterium]
MKLINKETLMKIADPFQGGSAALFNHVFSIYKRESPKAIENLIQAIETSDFDCTERLSHKLVSGSSYLGAEKLTARLKKIEMLAEEKNNGLASVDVASLRKLFNSTVSAISEAAQDLNILIYSNKSGRE